MCRVPWREWAETWLREPMLTKDQFDRTRILALRLAGIELFERHREPLCTRMRRLGISDPPRIDALLDAAEKGDPQAERQLISLAATRFTGFFRHPRQFEVAAGHALLAVQQRGHARLWCAAAATGEEPYSLAITLLEAFGDENLSATILASDVDADALAAAERGEYSEAALRALNAERRRRFFVESNVPRRWRVASVVRRLIEFHSLNLAENTWPVRGRFDVIFCRNVLMYLEARYRNAALEHMASLLAPDGVLILDPTEHLGSVGHLFTSGSGGAYTLRQVCRPEYVLRPISRPPGQM